MVKRKSRKRKNIPRRQLRRRHPTSIGAGLLSVLKEAAKVGYRLGKDKRYKRMGALGATGSYNRRPAPWEV